MSTAISFVIIASAVAMRVSGEDGSPPARFQKDRSHGGDGPTSYLRRSRTRRRDADEMRILGSDLQQEDDQEERSVPSTTSFGGGSSGLLTGDLSEVASRLPLHSCHLATGRWHADSIHKNGCSNDGNHEPAWLEGPSQMFFDTPEECCGSFFYGMKCVVYASCGDRETEVTVGGDKCAATELTWRSIELKHNRKGTCLESL